MKKLKQWQAADGKRWLELTVDEEVVDQRRVVGFDRAVDLFRDKILTGQDWLEYLGDEVASESLSTSMLPLDTQDPRDCYVSGFGYTHRLVNGNLMPERDAPDWYYKGNGNSLVASQGSVVTPFHACSAGFEVEYICIYLIDALGNPQYCGYTLAFDFSDPDLRHRHPSLAGLSKLRQTVVSPVIVLDMPPERTDVRASVMRDGHVVWTQSSQLGLDQLTIPLPELETMLFQHDTLCEPGSLHYVLLGASISSDKAGFALQDGDTLIANTEVDALDLSVDYVDEAVRCSCNC